MMAPRNAYPACQRCRRAVPVAPEDGTGVKFFLFLSRSMRHAPCAMLVTPLGLIAPSPFALCAMPSALCHLLSALCRMKLVLRLDVGRWSRILRVWEIVKN